LAFVTLACASFAPSAAHAVSCGTIAAPTSCSITVNGVVKYTFSAFTLVDATGSGGGKVYTAGDIAIDIGTGAGNAGLLTFSKLSTGPTPGVVFSANSGQTSNFAFSYIVSVEPAGSAGVTYGSPFVVNLTQQSHTNNATGAVQMVAGTLSAPCQAITGQANSFANCVAVAGQPPALTAGNIVALTGNTGNVSLGPFTNQFTVVTARGQGLDVDGNGSYGATSDGLLAIRYLLGLRGTALTSGAVGAGATRSTSTAIEQYLLGLTTP